MTSELTASGPSFVLLKMAALIDAKIVNGCFCRIAERTIPKMVAGSVTFVRDPAKHMTESRHLVTSPGGGFAEAIYQMEMGGLFTVYLRDVYAYNPRTQELARDKRIGG